MRSKNFTEMIQAYYEENSVNRNLSGIISDAIECYINERQSIRLKWRQTPRCKSTKNVTCS